ncbi:MAG: hypothetical protein S4CHLAM81_04160 [Chlamydiales bacterium]|nr:hypothetical protein [Chlamydiales bacterium]MCH9635205.1 hypothetical protein [Chlamydiales bacterium]MCH9703186.1 L,D-transpeptidase [Chlamydiota bacterium]
MSGRRIIIFACLMVLLGFFVLRTPQKKSLLSVDVGVGPVEAGASVGGCENCEEEEPEDEDTSYLPEEVDLMSAIYRPFEPGVDFVETVTYQSRVSWLTGRLAFLGDYASKYRTSKHFISHSLHGDYLNERVANGNKFKVLKEDARLEFHLLVDLKLSKLWLYAYDVEKDEKLLLKSYPVCCGQKDARYSSGTMTPTGIFSLGGDIAVYKPGQIRDVRGESVEMVTVFGTRWIPFDQEIAGCTGSGKGVGIHGVPWARIDDELVERRECMGQYESRGCIRMLTEDMEELFALVVSRPGFVHIVKDFRDAHIPGSLREEV